MRNSNEFSRAEARRIALAAQGFDRQRPESEPDIRHIRRVVTTLGLLQLDYVNVLMPAQYLVLWSRLGAYDKGRFERVVYGRREFTEQWAHEASIVPVASWPLLEHRRQAHQMHKNNPLRHMRNRSRYLEEVLAEVEARGGLTASDLPHVAGPKRKPGDWYRSIPRRALEFHFGLGNLAVAKRLGNFQRVYDLPERVIPSDQLARRVGKADAQRELLRIAASATGIATVQDLADYFRMSPRETGLLVQDLVEEGTLQVAKVEGWRDDAYLAQSARLPRSIGGASLLSPFDPVVWCRPRAERLFDFNYRIEIYVPAAKRKWGYYVLPFRVGDELVARVDLKADRKSGRLCVLAVHEERHTHRRACVAGLATELRQLAEWLCLEDIYVSRHNDVARQLAKAA